MDKLSVLDFVAVLVAWAAIVLVIIRMNERVNARTKKDAAL